MSHNNLALVTGSTAGIGFAIAENLAGRGFEVIINGRTEERVHRAMEQIAHVHGRSVKLHAAPADLTTISGIARVTSHFPHVEILVNNFGVFEPRDFADITDEDWEKLWNANLMSGARLSRHYFPRMLNSNSGRVIFISSESGVQIPVEMIHYGVTKSAQIALARGLAEAAAGSNVTVNSVLVGPTKSEGVGTFLKQLAAKGGKTEADVEREFFKTARATSLLKRFIRPEEVGAAVGFLASSEASAITGASIRVDGGVVKAMV